MARSIRRIIARAIWGRGHIALKQEFNALVDEMEELKTQYLLHEHSALDAAPDVGITIAATEAKKIG
jgi:hypothetical protein